MHHLQIEQPARQRSNSDSELFKPESENRTTVLPEIRIEDFSDKGLNLNLNQSWDECLDIDRLAHIDADLRTRSNTCPDEMSRPKRRRPPTPPPLDGYPVLRTLPSTRRRSTGRVFFASHHLSKVMEDTGDTEGETT
ncbi:hypothetical protein KP79_PYT17120 [Mizuhopecten yessoensis]|uniref:Uncharacterized protein n=1 Tax=Mizuhopecten yessoensis TaxID=6573 RepID=A0A210PV57_MIZYE|nr:hypothetical protein KP79_PYT17120 [Mizuhopecten yessoensis]